MIEALPFLSFAGFCSAAPSHGCLLGSVLQVYVSPEKWNPYTPPTCSTASIRPNRVAGCSTASTVSSMFSTKTGCPASMDCSKTCFCFSPSPTPAAVNRARTARHRRGHDGQMMDHSHIQLWGNWAWRTWRLKLSLATCFSKVFIHQFQEIESIQTKHNINEYITCISINLKYENCISCWCGGGWTTWQC